MKITKLKFKQIIKEELSRTLNENPEKMKALADELGGELQWDNDDQAIIYLDQEPAPGTYPPQMTYEDGVLYTDCCEIYLYLILCIKRIRCFFSTRHTEAQK